MRPENFVEASLKVTKYDAEQFLRCWRGGLLEHLEGGIYRYRETGTNTQFFWSGSSKDQTRSFTLWMEPIITAGSIAKLHFDLNWPLNRIASQSRDNAFDVVAYQQNSEAEEIAGEVKKTERELDALIDLMKSFGADPSSPEPIGSKQQKERNAYKKVVGLRARKAPYFWAVGPVGVRKTFRVEYGVGDQLALIESTERELHFRQ
jgi:hypothetical protein